MTVRLVGIITAILLSASTAAGEDLAASIARCKAIPSDLVRLACFDAIARATPAPRKPIWEYGRHKDPMSDRVVEWLASESTEPGDARLTLAVRCYARVLTVVFIAQDYLGYDVGAGLGPTIRFDDESPGGIYLNFGSKDLLVFGNREQEIATLKKLLAAKRVALRYSDRRAEKEFTGFFKVEGLREAMAQFGDRCAAPPN